MPKNRRNRSRNRGGGNERAKMRMDDVRGRVGGGAQRRENEPRAGRGKRSSNSPRRRELGHVMQNARRDGGHSAYWTKRLLEVEARVPDRWRHSGFDEIYRDELRKSSHSRSSSSSSNTSRSRSPVERPKSPVGRRPHTPVKATKEKTQKARPRSPPSPPSRHSESRERSRGRPRTPAHRRGHRRSNRSSSYSSSGSDSSCSDEDCSVCTPKNRKQQRISRSPPSPPSPPFAKKAIKRVVSNKRLGRKTPPEPAGGRKKQRVGRPKSPPHPRTPVGSSSGSSSSSSDSEGSSGEINETPKMTLSERFGKMAQWSVDRREYDSVSMKITKDSAAPGMKVVIAEDAVELDFPLSRHERPVARRESPERDYAFHYERRRYFFERTFTEERPAGPDAPVNWSDPLIRYSYYRRKGLLWEPDVSFDEYFKWETWWQRYQEWLEVERTCYGEDAALENARRERERDWESYRFSNLGRSPLERESLPLPKNEPWTSKRSKLGRNIINKGAEGFVTRKFLKT
ncbi:serine/arginine repetitive matrix protein 1-like [Neocloeon triangulifer]|uniref:serine/arginine repetitive matrix protein 1-like n=1 Tax=Neocloeon triangulifer TaxID=2078957 RepID=UPI00286F7BFE|nr:serine/arginine repetitive matrix protein 1-like [Neocloeon triangulifer]XP_059482969.1 serine/arginine repetitive matrix protein 1-like [Neocloeon triangulifer]XP_059482970.1 serine/arginine repetitive matrix protein 1-like [Neocloeon triangulifer]XP_059482971.1 serine/arginine repetitive matrix protein 1-like [Neocloeon triangulifer]XP_059482972.1 serine/arginine repetitive matrix protein 1-like [Neocloeon triangulifer]